MMRLLPGDCLWDRYRVERVRDSGPECAELSPLHTPPIQESVHDRYLLVSLDGLFNSVWTEALAAIGAAVLRAKGAGAAARPGPQPQAVPLLGNVEWVGDPQQRLAVVRISNSQPLSAVSAARVLSGAQILVVVTQLARALAELLDRCGGDRALLRPIARLLNPENIGLCAADARVTARPSPQQAVAGGLAPPPWGEFLAPELFRDEDVTPAAWTFGCAKLAAYALGVARGEQPATPEAAWAAFSAWAAGRLSAAHEFVADPQVASVPPALQKVIARCLASSPATRAQPARLAAQLSELATEDWATVQRRCSRCGFPAAPAGGPGADEICPCCGQETSPAGGVRRSSTVRLRRSATGILSGGQAQGAEKPVAPAGMTLIAAGMFLSGERKVPRSLRAFAIDTVPVTEAEYKRFLAEAGRPPRADGPGSRPSRCDRLPATGATWFEACEYAEFYGKRLPTVYEWEKAARGVDGRKFPYGESFKDAAAHLRAPEGKSKDETETPGPAPVGTHVSGASPFGVLDMAGNVLEWTSSARRSGSRLFRALKGACFLDGSPELSRCTSLQYLSPDTSAPHIGFRCVKEVEG